jgi:hypothetical protein
MLGCEEISRPETPSSLLVQLYVEGSAFLAAGDTLVGDTVQFSARVTEDGEPIAIVAQSFSSSNPSVIEILDASAGEATFTGVGESMIEVTITDPQLGGQAGDLQARMNVRVTQYTAELGLSSTVTGGSVDPADGLVGDTVQVVTTVRKDGVEVTSSGVAIESSDDTTVVHLGPPGPDVAALKGSGTARLTVTIDEPPIPGNEPLRATLDVTVKDFMVVLELASLVPGSTSLADGDTLVTDSVAFTATVIKAGDDTVPDTGPRWASSNSSVVRIVDDMAGVASFDGTGTASVSVSFDNADIPGEPFSTDVRVTTFVTAVNCSTLVVGSTHLADGDTLVTDSVRFYTDVTKDGQPRSSTVSAIESSEPLRLDPVAATPDEAVFADTGTARVRVTLSEPTLPRATLRDSLDLRITTYVLTADSLSSDTPVMGDTVQYYASVTDTQDDGQVASPTLEFASSNTTVVRLLDAAAGRAFARDTGTARVDVTLVDPILPRGTLADTFAVTTITEERFYGTLSPPSGDFQDTVVVAASEVHSFTDSTLIRFSNGTAGYVDSLNAARDTLWFIVGAGTPTSPDALTFINLKDDEGGERDTVLSRFTFTGSGTVDDPFEPNDMFPLDAPHHGIELPFDAFLSIDPSKTSPPDTNFYYVKVTDVAGITVDVRAETQQDANIDFFICNAKGGGINDPPEGHDDPPGCARPREDNNQGTDVRVEEELGVTLGGPNRHVFAFYCSGAGPCPSVPTTYKVMIVQQ